MSPFQTTCGPSIARTGREIWHATWRSRGGWHIGNRGVAVLNDTVYVETPDCNLVALNIRDGSERWRREICDLEQFYYASAASLIVKNHVIVGVSGDDLDIPGYLQAHDPETGALQWLWYTYPGPGTPEAKTVEDFAVDSSGFSTCRYEKWIDHKYGGERFKREWVKYT